MTISSVIDRVKKLLALSKSSNAFEAAAAANAANKLIDQHRLSESELETSDHESIIQDPNPLYESGRLTKWRSTLAVVLAKHYGCATYNSKGRRSNIFKLIGRKSDIEIVNYMFAWLSSEIERLSSSASKAQKLDRSEGKIFSNSFCLGAVEGIKEQLQASRKEAAAQATSGALVKLDQRFTEADEFMRNLLNLKQVKSYSKSSIDYGAYNSGKTKGQNIHLGQGLNAANGVRLLSS